ncbi:MAG: CHAT domain-containing protein, partial [Thermoanaerobaculia bacterium]
MATALLARARAKNRAFDIVLALEAAELALQRQPHFPEALFNRALALTHLRLRLQARLAWMAYFQADSSSVRAAEARRHLVRLSEPTIQQQWTWVRPRLKDASLRGDTAAVHEIVARFPQPARLWAEEDLFESWASAQGTGHRSAAASFLQIAHEVGAALEQETGDAMIRDAAAAVQQAEEASGSRLTGILQKGHLDFGRGMEEYNNQKLAQARPLFIQAEQALREAHSPFWGWAAFYGAVCDHYATPEQAFQTFSRLRESVDERRYPVLAGRAEWLRGTIANNSGRPEEALRRYRNAFSLLDASAGPQLSSFVHLLLAEAYTSLGDIEAAWRSRLAALAVLAPTGEPRRVHAALNEATEALLQQGHPTAALFFANELSANARSWLNPTALAESSLERGRTLDLLGRRREALEELKTAERYASRIGLRDRIVAPLALAQAAILVDSDPARAVAVLGEAISTQLDDGYLYQVTRLLTARAQAYRVLRDDDRAEQDLEAAIWQYERVRGGVREEQFRLSAFEHAQEAFDDMIRLQTELEQTERAFEYAERSRSRVLLDAVLGGGADFPAPRSAGEILSGLPGGLCLVEYSVLPERLLAWVACRGRLMSMELRVPKTGLKRAVDALRNALERRAESVEIRVAAAALYDMLVRPLERELPAGAPLIVVPDRFLVRVPFAALYDTRRGRFLIEDRAVVLAPSATLYLASVEQRRNLAYESPATALAVGDPAFARGLHPDLPRLAAANQEAAEVAALYPGSDLLRAEEATPAAFLAAASRHRFIHFAGHALLHPVSPRLSRLLLAEDGDTRAGSLYAYEIADQRLPGTELVVLSACRTMDGGNGQREALTGLTAAFFAAGPPVLVSSLWDVEDKPTRHLMRSFYASLRAGSDPADALRQAQISLLTSADPSLRSAACWAGFQALGGALPSPHLERR